MSMDVSSRDEREEERARQRRVAEELKASVGPGGDLRSG